MNIHEMLAEARKGKMMTRPGSHDIISSTNHPLTKQPHLVEIDIIRKDGAEVLLVDDCLSFYVRFSVEAIEATDWQEYNAETHKLKDD